MKVVVAIDSFKGSLSSLEAGNAAAMGIWRADSQADVQVSPLADGGEGTLDALVQGLHGQIQTVTVMGSIGQPVCCRYGWIPDKQTAIIEMSGAAGITLVPRDQLNPRLATTYGVGEVIRDAIGKGCRKFIVGLGGSATNDGGVGMLQALGFGFLDANGNPIPLGAAGLAQLDHISLVNVVPELRECSFRIACDVTNPLCGENGASAVYGPQKGADPSMVSELDQWLSRYAALTKEVNPNADPTFPGAGAAGGLGFGFLAYTNAKLESGIQIVIDATNLKEKIAQADLVVTGEGRMDEQTAMGKGPGGVAQLAKSLGKPVIAFAGCVTPGASVCNQNGIDAFFPILRTVSTLDEALKPENAAQNLADTAEQVFRLLKLKIH